MTQEQFNQNYGRIAMPKPFAHDGLITPIVDVGDSTHPVNFADGFPSEYSAPHSQGGKYVTRGEFNAIGNLATRNDFYKACGGLNTFNTALASKIGGYPKGAVLDHAIGNLVIRVMSLVDNNKYDFRNVELTSSEISSGIIRSAIDDIHWTVCNKETIDGVVLIDTPITMTGNYCLKTFKATSDCSLTVIPPSISYFGEYEKKIAEGTTIPISYEWSGFAIAINDFGTTPPSNIVFPQASFPTTTSFSVNWNGWKWLSGLVNVFWWINPDGAVVNFHTGQISNTDSWGGSLISGHYYAIAVISANDKINDEGDIDVGNITTICRKYKHYIQKPSGNLKIIMSV